MRPAQMLPMMKTSFVRTGSKGEQVKGETASKNKQMSAAALKSFLRGCLCVQAVLEEEYDRDVCLRKRASRRESGLRSIPAAVQIQRIGGSMNL
jgi:hypothetical protein